MNPKEMELMGWIIQSRWWPETWANNDKIITKHTQWTVWRRHLYKTKEIAEDALKQSPCRMRNEEFRYKELYSTL